MKKPKILGLIFVFLFANFSIFFNVTPAKAQSETQYREWSIMTFFNQCIEEQKETDKPVNRIDDLVKDVDKQTIVVGLGFDRNDGAWNCRTVIDKGMRILDRNLADKSASEVENAFCQKIVGENCPDGDTGMSRGDKEDNFETLRRAVITTRRQVNASEKGTDRQKMQPLLTNPSGKLSFLSFCYKLQTTPPSSNFDEDSEDFKVDVGGKTVWATLKRENDGSGDIRSVFDLQSINSRGAVGAVSLGFDYGGSGAIGSSDWNIASSDFYPLGRHYGSLADGYTNNSVVDCPWIEKNKSLVFGQIESVSDDGSYTTKWGETASTTEDTAGEPETCASESGSEFGWLICPVIEAAQDFLNWLVFDGPFENILNFQVEGEGRDNLEEVWSGFRAIANIVFVIAFFIIIYSAATGNFLSSYDVKKLLPRLFIVAILVQLSFFLSTYALGVANIIGQGIRGLMLYPVRDLPGVAVPGLFGDGFGRIVDFQTSDFGDFVVGGLAGIVVLIAVLAVVFYSITGIIILAAVFLIRDMGIIALIVVSPIAIALNVLPGTEKYFKSWWKWYFGLLVMYPAMVAFLTSGRLMAAIWGSFSAGGLMDLIITTAILFLPFYFAPKVLKFAGAAAGTLNGVFNTAKEKSSQYSERTRKSTKGKVWSGINRYGSFDKEASFTRRSVGKIMGTKSMALRAGRGISAAESIEQEDVKAASILLGQKTSGMQQQEEEAYLRKLTGAGNNSSSGLLRAAMARQIINKDVEGLEKAFDEADKSVSGRRMLERFKADNAGDLGKIVRPLLLGQERTVTVGNSNIRENRELSGARLFAGSNHEQMATQSKRTYTKTADVLQNAINNAQTIAQSPGATADDLQYLQDLISDRDKMLKTYTEIYTDPAHGQLKGTASSSKSAVNDILAGLGKNTIP